MAVYNQWDQAAQQHLALRRQQDSVPIALAPRLQPQVVLAEAAWEAHLAHLASLRRSQQPGQQPELE